MKRIFILIGLSVIVVGGGLLYFWAFGGGHDAPLITDNILVFGSEKGVASKYGYVGKTYTAAIPAAADRPNGWDRYLRVSFTSERPTSVVRQEAMAEVNRVRAQKGQKPWNSAALHKAQLWTMAADMEVSGSKTVRAVPDVTFYQRAEDNLLSELKTLFSMQPGSGNLAPDPGDAHVLGITGRDLKLTLRFSSDWSQAEITVPDAPDVKAIALQRHNIPTGPQAVKLMLTGILNRDGTPHSSPQYRYAEVREAGLISPTIPVFFREGDGAAAGKAYFQQRTYKIRAAERDGALKVWLDDDAFLSIDRQKPTNSFARTSSGFVLTYTAAMEQPNLDGKEAQLSHNYDSLGSVPETVSGAPNVWGTYFDLSQRMYTAQAIVSDPVLRQVFSQRSTPMSAVGAIALETAASRTKPASTPKTTTGSSGLRFAGKVEPAADRIDRMFVTLPSKRPASQQPAAAPDPNRPKTDAEIEREMQEALRKKRY